MDKGMGRNIRGIISLTGKRIKDVEEENMKEIFA
jgi:hypothetical protein